MAHNYLLWLKMLDNILVVYKGPIHEYKVGVSGVMVYAKPMFLKGGGKEYRVANVDEIFDYFKSNYIDRNRSYSIANYNLLDEEWSKLENAINSLEKKKKE